MKSFPIKACLGIAMSLISLIGCASKSEKNVEEVPVFITIGQSNADGSAFFDPNIDAEMKAWYESPANTGKMKMWYKSSQVENQDSNALGERARWAVEGKVEDVEPGWLDLWYRNENEKGRTAMNMIHGYGTYSTCEDGNCAQGRRGMEGNFGRTFATALPESELYLLKLGVSGSFISSWANPLDDTNWNFFYENVYKPAITDLIDQGKRPVLAGVWWMQGCADSSRSKEYYEESLLRLVDRIHNDLGFADGKIYVGHIVKPGESEVTPTGSTQYGQGVREAQDAVAEAVESVEIVDTKDFSFQYEANFNGYLHYDHAGVNAIGEELANRVIAEGKDNWTKFSTPGQWEKNDGNYVFKPAFGNPEIEYKTSGNTVTAILHYPGFDDIITIEL